MSLLAGTCLGAQQCGEGDRQASRSTLSFASQRRSSPRVPPGRRPLRDLHRIAVSAIRQIAVRYVVDIIRQRMH